MNPDALYALLVTLHKGLDEAESALVEARLVLLLAHELGSAERLAELIAEARRDIAAEA